MSDSSPIIYLTRLGCLTWLREFYGGVLIPPAVWREIVEAGAGLPESSAVLAASDAAWLRVQVPGGILPAVQRAEGLDPGEQEAISLAAEVGALLIIDEQVGRQVATRLGLRITGVVGIAVEAKARGLVPTLRSVLDRLVAGTTFRLSEEVRAVALHLAGEDDPKL